MQCIQAGEMPPLLRLQSLRLEYGPPLSVDQQLCGLLEQEILHAPPCLCDINDLLCVFHSRIRFLLEHQVAARYLLLFIKYSQPLETFRVRPLAVFIFPQLHDRRPNDILHEVPRLPGLHQQNHH